MTYQPQATELLLAEMYADEGKNPGWWHPKSPPGNNHQIFDKALMKFLNGNLYYPDLRNMVIHANDADPYWNPNLPVHIDFCKKAREFLGEQGPLGRMCLWKIVPGHYIAPHTDNYYYHRCIKRWIYFLNLDDQVTDVTFANQKQRSNAGTLLELQPFHEKHAFYNNSQEDWYFVVFDTWDMHMLTNLTDPVKDAAYAKDPARTIYMSPH